MSGRETRTDIEMAVNDNVIARPTANLLENLVSIDIYVYPFHGQLFTKCRMETFADKSDKMPEYGSDAG